MAVLRYGADSSVSLELAEDVLSAECGTPRRRPLDDVAAAAADALGDPLDYPALGQMTTPGDRIVLALGQGVPQVAQIAATVIRTLVDAGVGADGITVLQTAEDAAHDLGDPSGLLDDRIAARLTLATHDSEDRKQLAYLATTDAGEQILLDRSIHDADLVLPIGCVQSPAAPGYYGVHGAVFPAFSDRRTLRRYRSLGSLDERGKLKKGLIRDVEEVAWLLGINFTIQVVPGGNETVLHVLAGQSDAVARRGRELYDDAWSCTVPGQARLVVLGIDGDARRQTWVDFGRALHAAAGLVEDGGSIAVCCELADAPGPALRRLIGAESRDSALRKIRKERPVDALPAAELARALDRGKVYLLSRLEASTVEELEMIHVGSPDELARLARLHDSCILLSNAPHATVAVE